MLPLGLTEKPRGTSPRGAILTAWALAAWIADTHHVDRRRPCLGCCNRTQAVAKRDRTRYVREHERGSRPACGDEHARRHKRISEWSTVGSSGEIGRQSRFAAVAGAATVLTAGQTAPTCKRAWLSLTWSSSHRPHARVVAAADEREEQPDVGRCDRASS